MAPRGIHTHTQAMSTRQTFDWIFRFSFFVFIKSIFIGVIKNEAPSDGYLFICISDGYSFICIALAESPFETPFY